MPIRKSHYPDAFAGWNLICSFGSIIRLTLPTPFYTNTIKAILKSYNSLEWALNGPPKPHAFVCLPLRSSIIKVLSNYLSVNNWNLELILNIGIFVFFYIIKYLLRTYLDLYFIIDMIIMLFIMIISRYTSKYLISCLETYKLKNLSNTKPYVLEFKSPLLYSFENKAKKEEFQTLCFKYIAAYLSCRNIHKYNGNLTLDYLLEKKKKRW